MTGLLLTVLRHYLEIEIPKVKQRPPHSGSPSINFCQFVGISVTLPGVSVAFFEFETVGSICVCILIVVSVFTADLYRSCKCM